jgi:hypothetical protein
MPDEPGGAMLFWNLLDSEPKAMPTLYIDHSIVAHGPSWKPVEDVLTAEKAELALSLWNLFEIGSASDKAQRAQRLAFLEKFNPLWILERVEIQRQEVRAFLWREKFGVAPEPILVFKRYLSEVEAPYAGSETHIGLTPTQWISGVDFDKFDESKKLAPAALRQLQAHGVDKVAEREDEIFRKWIEALLPRQNPKDHALSKAELSEFLTFCEKNQAAFYAACPSMAVEDAFTRARIPTAARIPQNSDGLDLMHAVVALAYCEYFLVRDGFLFQCCEHARKELLGTKVAIVYRDAEELKKALV